MHKKQAQVFSGMSEEEIAQLKGASFACTKTFQKGERIFRMGDVVRTLGIVLEGSVLVENNDLWGNTILLNKFESGEAFAEIYALSQKPMMVEVVAAQDCRVLLVDLAAATDESYTCSSWYTKMLSNLLAISTERNLLLSTRIFCTSPKTLRGKLLAYLSERAVHSSSATFHIPFDRQQLADYLNADRSALSRELGLMKEEGLIDFRKNLFTIRNLPR